MRLEELKLGSPIEIHVIRGEYKLRLVSKIEAVLGNTLSISLIASKGRAFPFYEADEIDVVYKDRHRLYRWKNVSVTLDKYEEFYVHVITVKQQEGEPFNRRNSFRVYVGEEMEISWRKNEEVTAASLENKDATTYVIPGLIKDMSEGGAGICTDSLLRVKDEVKFVLSTECGLVECIGDVVRIQNNEHGIYKKFYGIEFTKVSNNISKYLFALQRLQLQNTRK